MKLWIFLNSFYFSKIITSDSNTFESFNAFQPILPNNKQGILYNIEFTEECQPIYNQNNYNNQNEIMINSTIISIHMNENCRSYVNIIKFELNKIMNKINKNLNYPEVSTILINEFKLDREGIGKPTSELGEFFTHDLNYNKQLNWVLVPYKSEFKEWSTSSIQNVNNNNGIIIIQLENDLNPWINLFINNKISLSYLWILKIIKVGLLLIEILFMIYVIYKFGLKSYIQLFLLFVGIQQLLGNLILNWILISNYFVKLFILIMLMLCGISNSVEIIAWSDIVSKINKQPLMKQFKIIIKFELIILIISQLLWAILLYFEQKSINNIWLNYLPIITFFIIVLIPLFIAIWFYIHAYFFVKIFNHYGKLIKAHKLTILIGLTRLGFMGIFTFSFLIASNSKSALRYFLWLTFNDCFMILFNCSIILTVIEILRLTKIKNNLSTNSESYIEDEEKNSTELNKVDTINEVSLEEGHGNNLNF